MSTFAADSVSEIAKAMRDLGLKDSYPKSAIGMLKEQLEFFKTVGMSMTYNSAFNDAVSKVEGAIKTLENEGHR